MLQIDPKTPKGQAQLEGISWAQDQMNAILAQYFSGGAKVIKGLKFNFKLRTDLVMNKEVKVELMELFPKTEKEYDDSVAAFKKQLKFESPIITK